MNSIKSKKLRYDSLLISKVLPCYIFLPILFWLIANTFAFYGSAFILGDIKRLSVKTVIDDYIPLYTPFISFYILAYLQWAICFIAISKSSRKNCYDFFSAEITGKLIAAFIFFIFPTQMVRTAITGNSVFDKLTDLLYTIDKPITLFPSLHCFESYVCSRYLARIKGIPKFAKIFCFAFSLLVFASTVLVKQHLFLDIPAGILVGELGILISDKFHFGKFFDKISHILNKKGESEC